MTDSNLLTWLPHALLTTNWQTLKGCPRLLCGTARHASESSQNEHAHFVPFYSGEAEWKKLVSYSVPEDAYLVVADADGHVLWQAHGAPTDEKYSELRSVIGKQVSKP